MREGGTGGGAHVAMARADEERAAALLCKSIGLAAMLCDAWTERPWKLPGLARVAARLGRAARAARPQRA